MSFLIILTFLSSASGMDGSAGMPRSFATSEGVFPINIFPSNFIPPDIFSRVNGRSCFYLSCPFFKLYILLTFFSSLLFGGKQVGPVYATH